MGVSSSASTSSPLLRRSRARPRAEALGFEAVFRAHYGFVWRTLLRLGVAEGTVDDAAQDVFVVVHHRLEQFEGRARLRTWLFEIARRVAMRYGERARRGPQADPETELVPSDEAEPDEHVSRAQALRLLQSWLDELDDDKREVFVLSELEEMPGPEIADALGVNVNTVYTRLRAARQHVSRRARRLASFERQGGLARLHQESGPSEARQERAWGLVCGQLGLVGKGAGAAAATGGALASLPAGIKAVVLGVALAGGALATVVAIRSDERAGARAERSAGPSAVRAATDASVRDEPASPRSPGVPPAASPAAEPVPVVLGGSDPLGSHLDRLEARHRGGSSPRPRSAAEAEPQGQDASLGAGAAPLEAAALAAELARFEQAQRTARSGDDEAALRELDGYLDRHPDGQFVPEARILRVRVLCRLGRDAEAGATARAAGLPSPACDARAR